FVLGPSFAAQFAGQQKIVIDGTLKLTTHPDLACTRASDGQRTLTLVGHILDPLAPVAKNIDILKKLLAGFSSISELVKATGRFGGRWIIVATNDEQRFLFNDALGLRQVFYTNPADTTSVWAMSQPGIGAKMLGLPLEQEAAAYMNSHPFRSNPEYRWPGEASPFKGLKHLLPNHWLDLDTGTSHRYWPMEPLARVEPEVAIERLAVLFTGMIRAAAQRFDLALGITAGLDSRLLLAAARDIKDALSFVTVWQGNMPDDHPDITIPGRLLDRLGLPHEVIRAAESVTPDFSQAFKRSVYLAHDHYGPDAEAILRRFSRAKAVLTGSGAEVGRCSFRKELPWSDRRTITSAHLARLQRMDGQPFAMQHFAKWLEDAHPRYNVKLLDLFEWEQGHGNWLAMTQLEFDIAWREIITPYNCRDVLTTLLAVDERYRRAPDYVFFHRLIEKLWPDVLQEPINPRLRQSLLQRLKGAVRSLPRYWS
ncbi:MAG: hypothetical protein WB402_01450, partial [Sulfuricaulis sp.]|uniref:hypothetical protein n=1 Tax=Sulfuricaulis sp. TaxID=2003553 RepID=UPI003C3D20F1